MRPTNATRCIASSRRGRRWARRRPHRRPRAPTTTSPARSAPSSRSRRRIRISKPTNDSRSCRPTSRTPRTRWRSRETTTTAPSRRTTSRSRASRACSLPVRSDSRRPSSSRPIEKPIVPHQPIVASPPMACERRPLAGPCLAGAVVRPPECRCYTAPQFSHPRGSHAPARKASGLSGRPDHLRPW